MVTAFLVGLLVMTALLFGPVVIAFGRRIRLGLHHEKGRTPTAAQHQHRDWNDD